MKHFDREPTRSVLLTNLPRVSGCQVLQLKAEICEVLPEGGKCYPRNDSLATDAHRKKTSAKKKGCKTTENMLQNASLPKRFTVYVQGLSTLIPVQVKSNDTIAVLKAAITQREGIKIPVKATLWCKGYKLVDLLTLDDQLVGPNSNLMLHMGLLGGSDKDGSDSLPGYSKDGRAKTKELQERSKDTDPTKQVKTQTVTQSQAVYHQCTFYTITDSENVIVGSDNRIQQQLPEAKGFSPREDAALGSEEWLVDTLHNILNPKNEPNCKPMTLKDLGTKFDNMQSTKKFEAYEFGSMKQFIENHKKQFDLIEKKGKGLMVVGTYLKKKQKDAMLSQKQAEASIAPFRREEDQWEEEAKNPCSSESANSVYDPEDEEKPNIHDEKEKTSESDACSLPGKAERETMDEHQPKQSEKENEQTQPITFHEKPPPIPTGQLISKQVKIWTVDEVCSWLQTLNINKGKLTAYIETFQEEDITGKALLNLPESDRKELGMSIGDWTEVKSEIDKLKSLPQNQPRKPIPKITLTW
ncbi:uncharacterized protein LOC144882567 isoform X2 [Branchiostoma floridae x Branchiostoma japonicum]